MAEMKDKLLEVRDQVLEVRDQVSDAQGTLSDVAAGLSQASGLVSAPPVPRVGSSSGSISMSHGGSGPTPPPPATIEESASPASLRGDLFFAPDSEPHQGVRGHWQDSRQVAKNSRVRRMHMSFSIFLFYPPPFFSHQLSLSLSLSLCVFESIHLCVRNRVRMRIAWLCVAVIYRL